MGVGQHRDPHPVEVGSQPGQVDLSPAEAKAYLGCVRPGPHVEVRVTDAGGGIKPDEAFVFPKANKFQTEMIRRFTFFNFTAKYFGGKEALPRRTVPFRPQCPMLFIYGRRKPFPFHYRALGLNGQWLDFELPSIFIGNDLFKDNPIDDQAPFATARTDWMKAEKGLRTAECRNQSVRFAFATDTQPPQKAGDTDAEVISIEFDGQTSGLPYQAPPYTYPQIREALVRVPAVAGLGGRQFERGEHVVAAEKKTAEQRAHALLRDALGRVEILSEEKTDMNLAQVIGDALQRAACRCLQQPLDHAAKRGARVIAVDNGPLKGGALGLEARRLGLHQQAPRVASTPHPAFGIKRLEQGRPIGRPGPAVVVGKAGQRP